MIKLVHIPAALVCLRFIIAPLLLINALNYPAGQPVGPGFIIGYIIAVLSDIFDGIIARRLGVSTVQLRKADSWADICLYLCIAASTWLVFPQVVLSYKAPLLMAIAAQLFLFTISLIKFGKLPSLHTYTAKAWGLTLLIATVSLFGFGYDKALWLAIALCLINSVEEIVMTLILPEWQCDVLSLFHAMAIRKTLRPE
jgi:phosphatidylglycerophosphate synthase